MNVRLLRASEFEARAAASLNRLAAAVQEGRSGRSQPLDGRRSCDGPIGNLDVATIDPIFFGSASGYFSATDGDTWIRARGWALALGLAYLTNSRDDEALGALGRATIDAALYDIS
jgi:hypothetical protein